MSQIAVGQTRLDHVGQLGERTSASAHTSEKWIAEFAILLHAEVAGQLWLVVHRHGENVLGTDDVVGALARFQPRDLAGKHCSEQKQSGNHDYNP